MGNDDICAVCGKEMCGAFVSHPFLRICSHDCFDRRQAAELQYLWKMRDDLLMRMDQRDEVEGIKHDAGKHRYDLLPPDALEYMVDVFTYGARKYEDRNWEKGMKWGRVFGATMRHLWAFWRGQDIDPESGLHHIAHAAANCLFLLAYAMRKVGEDDRQ